MEHFVLTSDIVRFHLLLGSI